MGGGSKKTTVGYKYYLGLHMIAVHGTVDAMLRIKVDEKVAWVGNSASGSIYVNNPNLFGGESREGGVQGFCDFQNGEPTQGQNDYLVSKLGANVPAFRGVAGLILRQVYVGLNPYLKRWSMLMQRIHRKSDGSAQWYNAKSSIPVPGSSGFSIVNKTFNPNLATVSADANTDKVVVSGLSVDDYLIITPIVGANSAWSRWLGYGGGAGYEPNTSLPLWWGRTTVQNAEGTITQLYGASYMTQAEAVAGILAEGTKYLTGSTSYKIWLQDDMPYNRGSMGVTIEVAKYFDMNPAHIIRECLTDRTWGMGYQDSDIDDTSFMAAADTLYSDRMGISIIWDRQVRIEEFIQEIVKHIYATLFVDRITGKFVLKLIRNDYDIGTIEQLDETNIVKIDNYSRPSFGELVNSVTVNYLDSITNKTASITVQDTALVQLQGSVVGTTIQYPGFSNYNVAVRAAQRDLVSLSTPLLTCQLTADRTVSHLNVGSVFKLYWPDFSDDVIPMRITGIAFGDGRSNRIRITCMQDIFVIPETVIVQEQVSGWIDPSQPPGPSQYHKAFEAPYMELVQRLGQTSTTNLLTSNPDAGFMLAAGSRPTGGINASVNVESGGVYSQGCMMDFSPAGALVSAISYNDTSITLNNTNDLDLVQTGWWGLLGDEIIKVTNVVGSVLTIGRGVFDTVPVPHAAGTQLLICDGYAETDGVEYVYSETLNVKIQTISGRGSLDLADAPIDTFTFNSRAIKPYPPGQLKVNTFNYPATIGGTDGIILAWAHRDRLQQTAADYIDTTSGNIGPEAGTTYTLKLYSETGALLRTESGISGTGYSYSTTTEISDFSGSGTEEPYWANVKLLLNMNGVDGSTTFTDSSATPLTFTASGNAAIKTAQYKFNRSSGFFDGASDLLTGPVNNASFNLGNGDFTIDCWIRKNAGGGTIQHIIGFWDGAGSQSWHMSIGTGGEVKFEYSLGGSYDVSRSKSTGSVLTNGNWQFIEWSRSGTTMRIFIDGVLKLSHTCGTDTIHFPTTAAIKVGSNTNNQHLSAYLQDLRLTKGSARHTSDYTPPIIQAGRYLFATDARLCGKVRFTLEAVRGAYSSYQMHDFTIVRTGYGFNYGERYGD